MTDLPYFERVKIQCEILLPLYKRLRTELGEQKAAAMLRAAVDEFARDLGGKVARNVAGTSLEKMRSLMPSFKAGDALSIEAITDNTHELTFNVRRCEYAAYFKALGETEFGAMVTCEIDPPITEALGDDLHLERNQTIMRGAGHCDFKWRRD